MINRSLFTGIAVHALWLAGCSHPAAPGISLKEAPATRPASQVIRNEPGLGLKAGMSAAAVRKCLGEPAEIKRTNTPGGGAGVWIYRQDVGIKVGQVQPSMELVPAFDPNDDFYKMVGQPVFSTERRTVEEVISLLVMEDTLLEWQRSRQEKR